MPKETQAALVEATDDLKFEKSEEKKSNRLTIVTDDEESDTNGSDFKDYKSPYLFDK